MATSETLKELVRNGSNLVIMNGVKADVIREIVELAQASGSKITLPTTLRSELVLELSRRYGNTLTFAHGLIRYEKE